MRETLLCVLPLFAALLAAPAMACGPDTDCDVALGTGTRSSSSTGTYRIHLPPVAPTGAILFAHGYRGSAAAEMRNGAIMDVADGLGVALVALDSGADDWAIPNAPSGDDARRDETAYVRAVQDDVAARLGVAPSRMILAGFSAGGMLTWNVACEAGGDFAAFLAISGTFWKEPPASCPTDAAIWHLHGTADTTVPIRGRRIGPTRQGDVEAVLAMYRADKGLSPAAPIPFAGLDCARWTGPAASLEYCLHPGGHDIRAEWLRAVWEATFPDG